MFRPEPVALPGLAVFTVGALIFFTMLLLARRSRARTAGDEAGASRAGRSLGGVMLQGFGIALVGFGVQDVSLDPLASEALAMAAIIAVLMIGAVWLFVWSSRTMGRNWSIVARTRADHELVQTGVFALIRHPIYTGMFLFMLAFALAVGHTRQLIVAIPVFAFGTWRRIAIEERLLRDHFGVAYAAYAVRVKRFVPGVF